MRRGLTWFVAVPLVLCGSQLGHVLAYRWVYPDAHVRVDELLSTGHGYMAYVPFVLGLAGAVLVSSLFIAIVDSARGRPTRALPPWAFALLPALAFTLQEHFERWAYTGVFPWFAVLAPTFVPGLLLQLPLGLAAYVVARFLLGTAKQVGRALAAAGVPPRVRPSTPASEWIPVESELPRLAPLGWRLAERGPPSRVLA